MRDATKKIYLIIPKLIEQPTWGDFYILNYKGWVAKKDLQNLKTGQSYELYSGTNLRKDISSSDNPDFTGEIGFAMEPDKIEYSGDKKNIISIQDLININPRAVLGNIAQKNHGDKIKILIKFTQAKGNSFQMHTKKNNPTNKWQAKPESWYYFEPGLITLGIKNISAWKPYEKACRDIDKELKKITKAIKNKSKDIEKAREEIKLYIKNINPWQYVNTISIAKDEIVDLSGGGVHHSWEEDIINHPQGNIVYELCKDVMDPVSSIRSFDKGKIKDDGSIREVHIDSYFELADRDEEINNPANHRLTPKILFEGNKTKIESLLRSKTYCLDKITLAGDYSGDHTKMNGSYHHLFIKKGEVLISSEESNIKLTKGHSCFIPAGIGEYLIKPISKKECEILKTFVE